MIILHQHKKTINLLIFTLLKSY